LWYGDASKFEKVFSAGELAKVVDGASSFNVKAAFAAAGRTLAKGQQCPSDLVKTPTIGSWKPDGFANEDGMLQLPSLLVIGTQKGGSTALFVRCSFCLIAIGRNQILNGAKSKFMTNFQ
jgi:hypothetical protein